jgi:hypothetical protein
MAVAVLSLVIWMCVQNYGFVARPQLGDRVTVTVTVTVPDVSDSHDATKCNDGCSASSSKSELLSIVVVATDVG